MKLKKTKSKSQFEIASDVICETLSECDKGFSVELEEDTNIFTIRFLTRYYESFLSFRVVGLITSYDVKDIAGKMATSVFLSLRDFGFIESIECLRCNFRHVRFAAEKAAKEIRKDGGK